MSLPIFDHLLLVFELSCAHSICIDKLCVSHLIVPPLFLLAHLFVVDELLGCLAKLPLLLPVVVEEVLVLEALGLLLAKHVVSFTDFLIMLELGLFLFLKHCLL